jgi:hypothetical protein
MRVFILLFFVFFTIGCKENSKKNVIEHQNQELQMYNDVLIELVEEYYYLRYLGEEGNKLAISISDTTQKKKRVTYLHNKLFNDSTKYKTIYLYDTLINVSFSDSYFVSGSNKDVDSMISNFGVDIKSVLDSLNNAETRVKANRFKSSTFRIKSITELRNNDFDGEIGAVNLSKVFLNKKKDEGVLSCQFHCGGLCGKGYVLKIKKFGNHWKIIDRKMTWIS